MLSLGVRLTAVKGQQEAEEAKGNKEAKGEARVPTSSFPLLGSEGTELVAAKAAARKRLAIDRGL
jgi:hypothetical protein